MVVNTGCFTTKELGRVPADRRLYINYYYVYYCAYYQDHSMILLKRRYIPFHYTIIFPVHQVKTKKKRLTEVSRSRKHIILLHPLFCSFPDGRSGLPPCGEAPQQRPPAPDAIFRDFLFYDSSACWRRGRCTVRVCRNDAAVMLDDDRKKGVLSYR